MTAASNDARGPGIVQNIGWGLAYLIGAWIGLALAVPPDSISPVWPAAGVALAGLLTHGRRLLPGLFIGCCLVQLTTFSDFTSVAAGLHTLLRALVLSAGSLLQAWVGVWLVRRYLDWPSQLARIDEILRFVFLAALVPSVIAPSVGVGVLLLIGAIQTQLAPQVWVTWWVGDSLGVLIVTPLALALVGHPRHQWRSRRATLGWALGMTLLLLLAFFRYSLDQANQRIQSEFSGLGEKALATLQASIREAKHTLDDIARQLPSSDADPGAISPALAAGGGPLSELALYREPGGQKQALLTGSDGQDCDLPQPSMQRLEPRPALLALAGRCGVAIRLPVVEPGRTTKSWLVGRISSVVLQTTMAQSLPSGTGIRLWLQEGDRALTLLDAPAHISRFAKEIGFRPAAQNEATLLGNRLLLHASGSGSYVASRYGWELWTILVAGFAFSGLLGVSLLGLTGQRARVAELVERRTAQLTDEIDEHRRTTRVLELHSRVLEMIATDSPLRETLDFICKEFESLSRPGTFASVMLVDRRANVLRMVSGPSIPRPIFQALLEFPIGEKEASCGTAIFRGEPVFACDIAQDEVWEKYRGFALENGLQACWSSPFRASTGETLGSFALTQTRPRSPGASDLQHIRVATNLCALAVERAHNNDRVNMLSLAIEENPSAVVITDAQGRIEYANHRFSALTGYAMEEIEGKSLTAILQHDDDTPAEEHIPWESLVDGESWHRKTRYRRKDASTYWAQCRAAPVRNVNGTVDKVIVTHEDVTELHRASERLAHQASHDQLTGLLNRMALERRLEEMRERAIDKQEVHTLCFIDMDRFKAVNDSCGHIGGDELLRQITRLMSQTIRKHDVLARVGGDEFAILFEHCAQGQARQTVEKLREQVAEYQFIWKEKSFHVGLSAGLVEINATSPSAEELLREADAACYEAKQHGRNQVRNYRPGATNLAHQPQEFAYINELRDALKNDGLRLYFQRIRALRPDVPDNIEILVRLERCDGSVLSPGLFLPAAERFGLVRELDRKVVRQTLAYMVDHPALHPELGYVAINLSGLSLDEEMADEVLRLLQHHQLSGQRLCFEITETAAIANLSQAQRFIAKLQRHGVRFALDDFGSGLSSYGYLKTLPVDILKIDGQFVRDILNDRSDRAIVRSIAELGQALGRPTVAEFVEDQAAIELLREIGVDYAQGYAIGRPEPLTIERLPRLQQAT